jgi:hypothetical protein
MNLIQIRELISHIKCRIFDHDLLISAEYDKKGGNRIYLQIHYFATCTKTGEQKTWKGGKHYLSTHMTEDEIVKRCYVAFEQAVKHEVMEGFTFDSKPIFNPHVNFRKLLEVCEYEVRREENFDT